MQALLRLNEAQQLFDGLGDSLLRPALASFFEERRRESVENLLRAVRKPQRDTMQEARFAGMVEAYDNGLRDLDAFAKQQLEAAKV